MEFINYVVDEMLVLIPALYVVGMILKATPKAPDWMIPYVLLALGVLAALFMGGLNVQSVVQGVLCAGAAVFTNQLIKQATEEAKK